MGHSTPLRVAADSGSEKLVLLHDHQSSYADGAEERVLEIVRSTADISSTSDDLVAHATDWPTRYHLDPARSNIVRALTLPADARVLEVGAGCGAVTRYLAETVALVDALEPVPSRAAVIAERTRDLASARVFIGSLEDIPDEAAYDVVVVIGVLEYVAAGADDERPYVDFLSAIRSRLVAGGTLVLAIENKFGAKYLAGAPEDHSNRVADSLESYPYGSPARTFSRDGLLSLMRSARLTPADLIALPDYKMTEAVIDTARVPAEHHRVMGEVSHFPSPDWMPSVGRFADERLLWDALTDAGLAAETGNSFLVLATKGDGPSLWANDLVEADWPVGLTARHTTATELRIGAGGLEQARSVAGGDPLAPAGLVNNPLSQPFIGPPNFLDLARGADDEELHRLVAEWAGVVDLREAGGGPVEWDLVPPRLVVATGEPMRPWRVEWHLREGDWGTVRRRGVALLADDLARSTRPERWPGVAAVRDLASRLGPSAGLSADGSWLELFLDEESRLLTAVSQTRAGLSPDEARQARRDELALMLARPIGPEPRLADRLRGAQHELAGAHDALDVVAADRARLEKEVSTLQRKLAASRTPPAGPARRSLLSRAPRPVKKLAAPVRAAVRRRFPGSASRSR